MKRLLTSILTILVVWLTLGAQPATAQQLQGSRWFFGEHIGLDFTSGPPQFQTGGQTSIAEATGSSVCDAAGRLQFYTDGSSVWNRRHRLMPNGNVPPLPGYISGYTTLTMPAPDQPHLYYVFQVSTLPPNSTGYQTNREAASLAISYFTVDMTRNGGLGDVVPDTARTPLLVGVSNALTALDALTTSSKWVVAHASIGDGFYAWHVTPQGIEPPVVSHAGIAFDSLNVAITPGGVPIVGPDYQTISLRASHRSDQLALGVRDRGLVQIFDFEPTTGVVGPLLQQIREDRVTGQVLPPGVAFADTTVLEVAYSPDLLRLYVSVYAPRWPGPRFQGILYQYDLTAPDSAALAASRTVVLRDTTQYIGGLQLGPDGRLYFISDTLLQTPPSMIKTEVNVITCPNELGAACGVRRDVVPFPYIARGVYLPVLNQTFMRNAGRLQIISTNVTPCIGDTVRLVAIGAGVDSVTWGAAPGVPAGATGAVQQFIADTVGTYTVTGTRPCGPPLTATLTIRPKPRPAVPTISMVNGYLATTSLGPYQWLFNGAPIPWATYDAYLPTQTGNYAVIVGDGCTVQSADLFVTVTGLADAAANDATLAVWPNPATGSVRLRLAEAGPVRLLDAVGRVVRETRATAGQDVTWDLTGVAPGLYVVRAGRHTRRLVVE